MDIEEVNERVLGAFWEYCGDDPEVQGAIYWIATFVEWLYDEGYEITPKSNVIDKLDK